MTSNLSSHRTTDIKPEMLSGVQNRNRAPHDKYIIRGIAHARANRKEDIFMQRRLVQNFTFILEWGQGTCSLMKHTRRWAYSWYLFPACCLLRYAAFFSNDVHLIYICGCVFIWYTSVDIYLRDTSMDICSTDVHLWICDHLVFWCTFVHLKLICSLYVHLII